VIGRILIGLVAIAAIIGALILGQGPDTSLTPTLADQPADVPGYSARNAEVVETGDDGRAAYTLHARLVRQRPNDNRVQLDGPQMTFVTTEGNTWHAQARAGLIHPDGVNVDLYGDVKLDGTLSGSPVVIATSMISYDTSSEVARTHAPVTFDSPGGQLGATGLVANLKEGSVRLESHIHGTFPPR